MYSNPLPRVSRLLLLTLVIGSIFGAATFTTHVPTHAAGSQPIWALPFSTGTSVYIGPLGLHDHNFRSMKDDRTGKVFTFSNKLAPDSLDFVLYPPKKGTSTIPTTSVASGTVLAVWGVCQLVLIDNGNGWWSMYLHLANIQVVSGNTVNPGTILGYPTTNKPPSGCGSVESTDEHVHFVLLNGSGTKGGYVSLLGTVLCGHQVVELNNDPTDIILQGLTQTKDQVFTVPPCFTEFSIPTSGSGPYGITAGSDGNLWFTEINANKIGRMTLAGVFTEFPTPTPLNNRGGITSGPDGNLWFTENGGKIGKITTSGIITEYSDNNNGSSLTGITSGPDGNLWFTDNGLGQIGRITPSGTITEFPLPNASAGPFDITSGPDGNLWFTEFLDNKIGSIMTSGIITEYSLPNGNICPDGITSGPDGNLWFTEGCSSNSIGKITTSGSITVFPVPASNSGLSYITSSSDGNLWFTEYNANQIALITPSGIITEFPIPTIGSGPLGITSGPDGNLWFTEYNANQIGRATS